jgi:hypothetical protein
MSDANTNALPQGPIIERTAGGTEPLTPHEAARSLAQQRYKDQAQMGRQNAQANGQASQAAPEAEQTTEPREQPPPPVEQEPALEADTAPAQEGGEIEAQVEAAELPPIDAPRSWSADAREHFRSLPRETQEFLAERESQQERSYHQRQREVAEQTKALEAKVGEAERARAYYEQQLPMLMQALQEAQSNGEFADIKSVEDMMRLAREDWPRYVQWDAHRNKMERVHQEVQVAQARQLQEFTQRWQNYSTDEDAKFIEKSPDLRDRAVLTKATDGAIEMLKDLGFTDDNLDQLWNGRASITLRDHRLQLIVRDALRYREAQRAARRVSAEPRPPVQRPGVAPLKGDAVQAQIQQLSRLADSQSGMAQMRTLARLKQLQAQAGLLGNR